VATDAVLLVIPGKPSYPKYGALAL
jgi:hypothetical protein